MSTGTVIGTLCGGYLRFSYRGKSYAVHRVVWELHHGPVTDQVDHINGDKLDNRIENLRPATHSQNNMNKPARSDNVLGIKGVFRRYRAGRYEYVGRVTRDRKVHTKVSVNLDTVLAFVKSTRAALHGEFAKGA